MVDDLEQATWGFGHVMLAGFEVQEPRSRLNLGVPRLTDRGLGIFRFPM